MTEGFAFYIFLGAAAGGFINGLAGTATALFALGFYLVVLPPVTAVAVVAAMSVLTSLLGLWVVRAEILNHPRRLARFMLPGLLGVPMGVSFLQVVDASTLRYAIAVLLIVYGAYFGFRSALPVFERRTPVLDGVIGFAGGFCAGAAALAGAVPNLFLSLRPWSKTQIRATLQSFNMSVLSTTVAMLTFRGAYEGVALSALSIAVPVSLCSALAGIAVFRRVSDGVFRRLLILLSLVVGVGVLLSELA
ncbi:MAG: sulfite exporter TauE/SafE family protein [Pseudomonadota bacterium]